MGTWSVAGGSEEYSGFLYRDGDNLQLTLYLTIVGNTPSDILEPSDPRLTAFAPPNQPTVFGQTKAAGHVTLFNCAQINYQSSNQLNPPQARVELTLRPAQAWTGSGFVSNKQKYHELSFRAPGLHNILSTLHIDNQLLVESKPRRKSPTHKLKKLTGAHQAFLVHQAEQPKAKVVKQGKSYEILLASSISQSGSSVNGTSIMTSDSVFVRSDGATLAELLSVSFEVEQFISLLCIGPFRGERISVQLDTFKEAELFWKLGMPTDSASFKLMPHQMLVPLGRRPDLTKQALEKWFAAGKATQLARWLIFDALFTEVSSTSKFLSVAQAWEVSGREESKTSPYDKTKFRKVCKEIDEIIGDQLGKDAAERLLGLLRFSNRESFATLVENTTKKIPELALNCICGDVPKFISAVVKTRNVLTHMQGDKKLPLEVASYLSLFLTYKLIVLYCIHACVSMGLPTDNLSLMLANNAMAHMACRPLPAI
jgi:hypothetical protein